MAKRKRIGLLFYYDEDWIAGAYYILNIIHALNTLKEKQKPIIVIISNTKSNFEIVKKETFYPYLNYFEIPFKSPYTLLDKLVNKIFISIFRVKLIKKKSQQPQIDFLYPFQKNEIIIPGLKKVNWIPDLQELHLPEMFPIEVINSRKNHYEEVINKGDVAVFSSEDAKEDFVNLFKESMVEKFVIKFAVTHPNFRDQDVHYLERKYNLPKRYYFSPNQFWAHKNHITVLKAVKYLKDQGVNICVVFTGKENDHRNANYVSELKSFIELNQLNDNARFLGFLPRKEQLCLMQNSIAIIQPSLFEGWSTVVEDAKSLNRHIILSNINVHKEQINIDCTFFDPNSSQELALIIAEMEVKPPKEFNRNYEVEIKTFGNKFLELIELVTK